MPPARHRSGRRALIVGALVAVVAAGTWLGRGAPEADAIASPGVATTAAQSPAPAPVAVPQNDAVTSPEETVPAPSQRPRILLPPEDDAPEDIEEPAGAVAQVPLFGPTSLNPGAPSAKAAARPPETRALARVKVADQAFRDAPTPKPKPESRLRQRGPAEFASGRLHLPIVYRLRLDEPGDSLRGERTPTGFDVIIPARKTMESGTAISRRDPRIAKVSTKNGADGARVSFRFRSGVPAYKVRLRKDFVEFFISAD
jgi:hypothetical protein